jgi:hypothetical protein
MSELPKVETIKTRNGQVAFHYDPTTIPSKNAKLSTRLEFAAAFIRRALTPGAGPSSLKTFALCAKWIEEGVATVKMAEQAARVLLAGTTAAKKSGKVRR